MREPAGVSVTRSEGPALSYRERLLTIGVISRRSGPIVKEYRTEESGRVKQTTDELGNTVTQHAKGDRQDVHLRPQAVSLRAAPKIGD